MANNKIETAVPSAPPKPSVTVSENDAKCLKGKEVGQMCTIEIKGKITGIRQPESWEKEPSNKYTIEIHKVAGCGFGSKRA